MTNFSRSRFTVRRVPVLAAMLALIMKGHAMAETLDFDDGAAGRPPQGWTLAATGKGQPKWTIEPEATAPSKPNVLKQSGTATFPVALKNGTAIRDGFVEVKFKAIDGAEDRAAGLIWRAKDADNYYVVRANALEDNVRFYRVVKGRREQIEGVDTKVSPNEWHQLGLRAEGDRFTVTFNGKRLFTATDRTFTGAGKVALWTKADSVTRFDSIEIRPLP